MDHNKRFDEYYDSVFKHSNTFTKAEYEEHYAFYEMNYEKLLPSDSTSNILDIGCGTGHFLYFLKRKKYQNFLGVDVSKQQVDFCKKNVTERVQHHDTFDYLENKKNAFDVIVANDLIEHIPKDRIIPLLILIKEALTSTGVFIARTPNLGNPFSLRLRYADFTHEVGLTEKSLYQVLWSAGFRDIQIIPRQEKSVRERLMSGVIQFCISKLMWYQGFVAPKILSPVLICAARK